MQNAEASWLMCKLTTILNCYSKGKSRMPKLNPSLDSESRKVQLHQGLESCSSMEELKQYHSQMIRLGLSADNDDMGRIIKFCAISRQGDLNYALNVHAQILKFGYHSDGFCLNNLILMYVSFKSLEEARKVFDKMPQQDVVSWTTLISGYSQSGYIDDARRVFDLMPQRNPASYNAMIAAYVQSNHFREAFLLFDEMRSDQVKLDKFVAASMLSACTGLGAMKQGEWIHDNIKKSGIEIDPKLATTIIDMYCKCGSLEKAFDTFNELPRKGVSSWNCMIGGFAMHGKGEAAIELFKKMGNESIPPDYITFVNLLSACAHSGLVKEGHYYFQHMVKVYNIMPGMEHYGCMVDLLGRAGKLDEAMKLIKEMPMSPDVGVLGALLGACKIHKNVELGEQIGKKVIELEPHNSGRYVLLANIYASASKWEQVANIRKLMNDRGVKKAPGFSLIEMGGKVNEFIAGGRAHPDSKEIYAKVSEMLACIKSIGYVPEPESVLQDISEEDVENPLFYHSEKLAIAFGLLKAKPGETFRITKNLRVCKDCHEASKLISKYFDQEIIVRDRSRFHHFKHGGVVDVIIFLVPSRLFLFVRTDIPEADMPPRKRACLTAPTPGFEIGKSSAAGVARQPGPTESDLRRCRVEQAGYGTDTWDEIVDKMMEIAPTTLEGVNERSMQEVIEFATEMRDKKMLTHAERQAEHKRKFDDTFKKHPTSTATNGNQGNRAGNGNAVAKAYAVGTAGTDPNSNVVTGTEGVVGLARWAEKMESVFQISNCTVACQVKFASCTLQGSALTWWNSHMRGVGQDVAYAMPWAALKRMITNKYRPRGEIQKLES
nr:pentatricopeptide repeat-containing protein At5g66520-like [Tanacetum cinerariifolium]